MLKYVKKIIENIENSPTSFWLWLASFTCVIALRILVENWLDNFRNASGLFLFYEFAHTFLFFLIAYLIFLWILQKFLKIGFNKISNVLLWGYFLIISPPIADHIISGGQGYWSFYKFDSLTGLFQRFLTFFGDKPEIGITYGVRIEVALALVFIFAYNLLKLSSKNNSQQIFIFKNLKIKELFGNSETINKFSILIKSLLTTTAAYIVFFLLGTFPAWITIAVKGFSKGFLKVNEVDTAQMFLAPAFIFSKNIPDIVSSLNVKMSIVYSLVLIFLSVVGCLLFSRKKTLSFFANARYPQLLYHWGLIVIGMGLASLFSNTNIEINFFNILGFLVLLLAVLFAWLASVVSNDIEDKNTDALTPNKNRPFVKEIFSLEEYKTLGWILFAASIFFSAIVNFKIALLLLVYQAIAWIYSCPPIKLKRFVFVSTFVSALALLMVFFSGFILVSPDQSIKTVPASIISLFIFGCVFILPIKDFKDIIGDKKEGNRTIPVLFGEQWGKIIVGSGTFISFILSVLVFNEPRLFWWAMLCGGVSYWIIYSSGIDKRIKYHRLPWWVMGVVTAYGLTIIKIIFL